MDTNKNNSELSSTSRNIVITIMAVVVMTVAFTVVISANNPFYVVTSGSMIPALIQDDVAIVYPVTFDSLKLDDIIVFTSAYSGSELIYIHRIVEISENNEMTIKTKGDNNKTSLEGLDYPITENEYIGKVMFVIPSIGIVAKALSPPINYIGIGIFLTGVFLVKFRKILYRSGT